MSVNLVTGRKHIAGARPFFSEDDMPEILERMETILRGGRLIFGENTRQFEENFRCFVGTRHAVSVNSCTTALEIAFRFYDVRDREVLVPTNTFASVVTAVMYSGGIPVLVEMDPHSFCLDTDDLLSRINSRTAGIVVIHLAGQIYPDIDEVREVASQKGLFVIEDCSHAHGATIDDRKAGSLVDAACFSFYPTKLMTTGTGGMLTTDNGELAAYARSLRHHGQGDSLEDIENLGNDWCMTEIGAVLGAYQLARLEENVEYRNRVVEWYRRELVDVDFLEIPQTMERYRHSYYKLPVLLAPELDKKQLCRRLLTDFHIETGSLYDPPCHLQPVFRRVLRCYEGMFPIAESVLRRQICLPIHSQISEGDVRYLSSVLQSVVDSVGH